MLYVKFVLPLPKQKLQNMKTKFLFPHNFKKIGWILLVASIISWITLLSLDSRALELNVKVLKLHTDFNLQNGSRFEFVENNISDEVVSLAFIIGAILVGFSKTKVEDEYISKIRFESLAWATYANYIILFLSIIAVYDLDFLNILIYNMFTTLILFICRFNFLIYRSSKAVANEK